MNRIAFRNLRERKARTAFTLIAVILGVALVSGTFVLTDTISKSFDTLVARAGVNVDVKVLSRNTGDGFGAPPVPFPESVGTQVAGVDGVAASAGVYGGLSVTVADGSGTRVGPVNGAPTLAFSAVPTRFDPFEYEGRPPRNSGEIALSASAAADAHLRIGDRVQVQGTGGIRGYDLVGTTTFGGAGSTGGAAFVVLTLPEVQALAGEPGKITDVDVQANPSVTQTVLKQRVGAVVGPSILVRTGAEDSQAQSQDLSKILGYLRTGLLVFGIIALLVGSFVIFNTFTITVAQRTREFGMLRTVGASRRQVLQAVVLEALLIGAAGSLLGLLAGIGLAPLLSGLLGLIGFDLPNTALVIAPRTIVTALLLGTAVTLLSSLAPAIRATRISPMAAMRDGATGSPTGKRRWVRALQSSAAGLGLALMLVGLFGGLETSAALTLLGSGAVLVFIGVGLLAPLLVGPIAALIGRPLAATGGVAAQIARGNAVRSPGRTAGTASALMIGVALVAFVSIFVNGFKASFSGAFEKVFTAQFVVFDPSGLTPEAVAPAAARLDGVSAATNIRVGAGHFSGKDIKLTGLDPQLATKVLNIDWADGSDATLRELGPRDAMLKTGWASDHALHVGSTFELRNQQRTRIRLTVRGTYDDRGQLFGDVLLPDKTLRGSFNAHTVLAALIATAPGASQSQVRSELSRLLEREFPTLKPQTRQEFIDAQVGQVNAILYVFYALLALSVIIALFGIVNTLALSVYERTRELGLLRAVGATRRQIRQIVRGEAIITAVMGAILGVAIGVVFGVLVSRPLGDQGFVLALPYGTLFILLVLGVLAGTLAAIGPARRASRIDVLDALTHQ